MAAASPSPASPFTHGVASFDPTGTAVLLWARAPGHRHLRWAIAPASGEGLPVRRGDVTTDAGADWCVTVDVPGLRPGTTYRYWFETDDGSLSPVGRTRTLPGEGVTEARVAVVCCSDVTMGWFTGYRAIAEEELDLVLHLGDAIYEAGKGSVRADDLHDDAVTLDDYRRRHATTRADPDLRALLLRHPMVFVWDDHDVADNAWRHGAKGHDPERHGPFESRLTAAAQARQEWMPARLRDPDDLLDMHRALALGDLAELVVLDTRIPGRDQQADGDGAPALDDPGRTMLGDAQRNWALQRIADRRRPWSLVASAVTLSPLQLPITPAEVTDLDRAMPSGYAVVDGLALCTDEWDGYPRERDRLIEGLRARGGGAVVLSGDIHSAWALEVRDPADGTAVAAELVAPSLTATPMGRQLPRGGRGFAERGAELMPHRRWSDLLANGWLRVSVDRRRVRADWFAVPCDAVGGEPHEPRQGQHLASWDIAPTVPVVLDDGGEPLPPWPDRGGVPAGWLPPSPRPHRSASRGRKLLVGALAALAAAMAGALVAVSRRRGSRPARRGAFR